MYVFFSANESCKILAVDGVSANNLRNKTADKDYQVKISGYGWWTASYVYPTASNGGAVGGDGALSNQAKYNLVDETPITYAVGTLPSSVMVNGRIVLPAVRILTGGTVTCKYVVMDAEGHTQIYNPGNVATLSKEGVCRIVLIMSNERQTETVHFEIDVKGAN